MTESMDAVAARAEQDPVAVLDEHSWLGAAIDADAAADRFARWGSSTVIDEYVGEPVLSRGVFVALHERSGIDAIWPVGNAGVLHVYGYLLSRTPTPYGLKRERWLAGTLARAYGLEEAAFVPWSGERTLLDRVTDAASALIETSTVRTVEVSGVPAIVAIGAPSGAGSSALAYSVGGALVTTFPVASADDVLAEWDGAPARLRWNAVG